MAAFAAVFHITPADYWRLTLDEHAALADQLRAMQKAAKNG